MALNQDGSGVFWGEQDKDSILDYSFDWSDWLVEGDTIASSTWDTPGSDLTLTLPVVSGVMTTIWVQGGTPNNWYAVTNTVQAASGRRDQRTFRLFIKEDVEAVSPMGSALFPNRFTAVAKLRRDRLTMAASGVVPQVTVSDDYLWDKLRAAESEMSHELRVPLAPTAFFPDTPTADQIAALNGMPWGIDPGYEYDPVAFGYNDKWGLIKTRQKPIQSVSLVRFAYPGGETAHYDLPLDWLRMDKKYGTIQFVPSSSAFIAPLNAFVMQAIGAGRIIPLAIQLNYVAGLDNAQQKYPELIDAIFKKAAIKIVEDLYLPQSGSISADGLSQSMSVDLEKYRDSVDRIINGEKGTNGGLMTAIHGVRMGMLGG